MQRDSYGVLQSNEITPELRSEMASAEGTVALADPRLARIFRLRLVSDPGFPFWDLSYCFGRLKDGTVVRVQLPEYQFPKRELTASLLRMCREAGVYGKGLGIFDPEVISQLV
jgi:hypothetical protein